MNTYSPAKNFTRQHPLITGTLLLTAAGFLSRIIGFFYRIYLSRLFGEEGMGIYQLIHPVSALAFSLTGAAFQTAISKFVASQTDTSKYVVSQTDISKYAVSQTDTSKYADFQTDMSNLVDSQRDTSHFPDSQSDISEIRASSPAPKSYKPLLLGASISLPLSILAAIALYFGAAPIATYYLAEPRTENLIRLLAFTIPFSAAHACINGYFYGIRKASVPAGTQFLEQFFRVSCVMLTASLITASGHTPNLSLIVIGLIIGEAAGLIGAILLLLKDKKQKRTLKHADTISSVTYRSLLSMVIPLAANRVFLNGLQSIEAASLPARLRAYGYDHSTALSVYGVLTGMAFPLIFFPNALTGSISVLLLPTISEDMANGRKNNVKQTIIQTVQYCSILGFFCMAFFLFFGRTIGTYLFESDLAGYFISELSFLCPFLYLNSTLSGILQGLGKATTLFVCNVTTLALRLVILYTAVPVWGMEGYLWGLLLSQITLTALSLGAIIKSCKAGT